MSPTYTIERQPSQLVSKGCVLTDLSSPVIYQGTPQELLEVLKDSPKTALWRLGGTSYQTVALIMYLETRI